MFSPKKIKTDLAKFMYLKQFSTYCQSLSSVERDELASSFVQDKEIFDKWMFNPNNIDFFISLFPKYRLLILKNALDTPLAKHLTKYKEDLKKIDYLKKQLPFKIDSWLITDKLITSSIEKKPKEEKILSIPIERKKPDDSFQNKLRTAIEYANTTCILGASNKMQDLYRTSGWISVQRNRTFKKGKYMKGSLGLFSKDDQWSNAFLVHDSDKTEFHYAIKQWYYHVNDKSKIGRPPEIELIPRTKLDPLNDTFFKIEPTHKKFLEDAIFTQTVRYGNCGSRASLVSKYLWEHTEGIHRIEGIYMNTIDHIFVVINRSGNLKNPDTWGEAWVIDAWYKDGIAFPAKELKEQIKKIKIFFKEQKNFLKKLNITCQESPSSVIDIGGCAWDVNPKKDRYPSYSKYMRVEDYYIVANGYPEEMLKEFKQNTNSHLNMEKNIR